MERFSPHQGILGIQLGLKVHLLNSLCTVLYFTFIRVVMLSVDKQGGTVHLIQAK